MQTLLGLGLVTLEGVGAFYELSDPLRRQGAVLPGLGADCHRRNSLTVASWPPPPAPTPPSPTDPFRATVQSQTGLI